MKRFLSILLVLCALLALAAPALALNEGEQRVVIGADLTEDQILSVYSQFAVARGGVKELKVTNAEERDYLEGVVSESVIGTRSISCIYIRTLGKDRGLSVTTSNISWCTEDMYRSALMTAGIYDAEVKVAAPFAVSGTAALTGIYKAYEDITGIKLQEEAKSAAADELVVTAQLADALEQAAAENNIDPAAVAAGISDADAVAIVNELKLILDETQNMSDDELRSQIVEIAASYGYQLDDSLIRQLISLCRSLEGLSIADLTDKVEQFKNGILNVKKYTDAVQEYADKAADLGEKVTGFFKGVGEFFTGLFSK